jgi:hypothetical protein
MPGSSSFSQNKGIPLFSGSRYIISGISYMIHTLYFKSYKKHKAHHNSAAGCCFT